MMRLVLLAAAVLSLLGSVTPLSAGPMYRVNVNDPKQPTTFGGTVLSSTPGISISDSFSVLNVFGQLDTGNGFATASQGSLGAAVMRDRRFLRGEAGEVNASARFIIDDLVFSSPTPLPFIDVTLPLHLSGSTSDTDGTAIVSVEVDTSFSSPQGGSFSSTSGDAAGVLKGLNIRKSPGDIKINTTIPVRVQGVPVNVPTTIKLVLGVKVGVDNASASSDFGSTFGFVTDGPTFIVPAGVTVNSAQAGIVNNRFGAAAQVVPEPGSMAIWLSGLGVTGLVGLWKRRRRKRG